MKTSQTRRWIILINWALALGSIAMFAALLIGLARALS